MTQLSFTARRVRTSCPAKSSSHELDDSFPLTIFDFDVLFWISFPLLDLFARVKMFGDRAAIGVAKQIFPSGLICGTQRQSDLIDRRSTRMPRKLMFHP